MRGGPALAAAALVLGSGACARQGAPPGGPEDRRPPLVVGTVPDTFARAASLTAPIRIRFNERISERASRGTLASAVLVSPRTGDVRVGHARDALDVEVEGGLRPGLVYRVTLLPVVQDMFGNTMREPFEFVFSTGGTFAPNVVAGVVVDRTTGDPVEGYLVRAVSTDPAADSTVVHVATTDTAGFFALRYLPPGGYELTAFQDLNRNRRVDFSEARGSRGLLFRDADTLIVEVPVLRPDTSAAVLGRVEPLDSVTLRLGFDDHLDPSLPAEAVAVALARDTLAPPDAPLPPGVARVLHPWAWEAYRDSVAAALIEAGDTARARGPARRLPRPGGVPTTPGQERGRVAGEALPSQQLYVLLDRPLAPDVPYRVTVTGVVNLSGRLFGGGSAVVVRPAPPVAPPADTVGAAADTLPPPADTLGTASDTLPPAVDTLGGAPPDTVPPRPPHTLPGVAPWERRR